MLISEAVHIWRDADGDYHLEWDAGQPDTDVAVEALAEQPHDVEHYRKVRLPRL